MILDFVLICFKYIGFVFLINFIIGIIFTLVEALVKRKRIQLNTSSLFSSIVLVLYIISMFLNLFIYSYLIKISLLFYNVEVLSRIQLLFLLIPVILSTSLMKYIANNSDRNFKENYSNGIIMNNISGFIRVGTMTIIFLQIILLIYPKNMRYLIIFFDYIF